MTQSNVTTTSRRIDVTPQAAELIERLRAKHGPLMFHQAGKGRDDCAPLCYPEDEFFLGHCDVCLGSIAGVPYYVSKPQFELWSDEHLTVDVGAGRGGPFSLENGLGVRFFLRTRAFTPDERASLRPVKRGCPDGGPAAHVE